jgi:hypothetical protein
MGKIRWINIDQKSQPNHVYVVNCKTSTGLWKPLFNARGEGTVSAPDGRAGCHESASAQGGLMLRRDGSGLPWGEGRGAHLKEDHPSCGLASCADVHIVSTPWRCHRIQHVRPPRRS